jgi:hypothetical protein
MERKRVSYRKVIKKSRGVLQNAPTMHGSKGKKWNFSKRVVSNLY